MTHTALSIGFARLSDCAVLASAQERGAFAKYDLDVTLQRYESWAAMRDALGQRAIDAAHMLSPMVVASAAGLGPFPHAFTTAFAINLNGNAITVSNALYEAMCAADPDAMATMPLSARALKQIAAKRRAAGEPPLVFAHVFTYSMHAYELRYWLSAAGVDPARDVRLVVIPPGKMAESLANGSVDGYCVGEPWNTAAVNAGLGRTLITSAEIWGNGPEKVLAVRRDWTADNEDVHRRLISALLETAAWLDAADNRRTAAQIIARQDYVDVPLADIESSLTGHNRQTAGAMRIHQPNFNIFHRYAANFPWRSHAKWILAQMIRWGEAPRGIDSDAVAREAFLSDFYREVAQARGVACPLINEKVEGAHAHAWLLSEATTPIAFGPDQFLDGRVFDPAAMEAYLDSFAIAAPQEETAS